MDSTKQDRVGHPNRFLQTHVWRCTDDHLCHRNTPASLKAETVCELLRQLAALHLDVPITIFLDNARYQKRSWVISVAANLNIELCFLPAYSPNHST